MFDLRKAEFALASSVFPLPAALGRPPRWLPTPAETQCPRITTAKVHRELESLPLPLGPSAVAREAGELGANIWACLSLHLLICKQGPVTLRPYVTVSTQ